MPTFEELRKQLLGGDVDQPKVQTAEPREKAKEAQTFENLRKQMLGTNGTANKATSTGVLQTLEPASTRAAVKRQTVLRDPETVRKELLAVNAEIDKYTASIKNPGVLSALATAPQDDVPMPSGGPVRSASDMNDVEKMAALQSRRDALIKEYDQLTGADDRTWFQKGAFEDGYQRGDVTKAVLGTKTDAQVNLGAGVLGLGEKAVDAAAAVAPYNLASQIQGNYDNPAQQVGALIGQMIGSLLSGKYANYEQNRRNELAAQALAEAKPAMEEFIKKDLYDEKEAAQWIVRNSIDGKINNLLGVDAERDSVLGKKTDALMQSAGQLAAQYGLSLVGVPWFVTSGVSSFGSEAESALQQGATLDGAVTSGLVSAGAEILTEKLFGGDLFVKNAGFDALTDTLTKGITHKFIRKAAQFGLDAAGEGAEEWVSQRIGQFGQWLGYKHDERELLELLYSEESLDEALEAFFSGTALGGGMSAIKASIPNAAQSTQSNAIPKGGNTQTMQETATEPAAGSLEWVKELSELGKPTNTSESRRLTEADMDSYMRVGERRHVRDTKQRILDNGESPILTKPAEIVDFIRNAFRRKIQNTVKGYGRVNNRLANAVKSATNGDVNIDDYYLELDADKIAHISDHVKQDKDIRNIPLSEEQLEQLPEYIDNYDDLIDVIRRKDGSVRLMLGKKINGHSIILETVSKGRKSLHPVTAYQIDSADYMKYYKTRAIDRSSTSRPANADTVDISRPAIALNDSISETTPSVNTNSSQTAQPDALQRVQELYALGQGKEIGQTVDTDSQTSDDQIIRSDITYFGPSGSSGNGSSTSNQTPASAVTNPTDSLGAAPSGYAENTVGGAQSKFEHKRKTSKIYSNTYENATDESARQVGADLKATDPNIDKYDAVTEKESLHNAELRTRNEEEINFEYEDLISKSGWTGEDNDTAWRVLDHLRKNGDTERFTALARKRDQEITQSGQLVQSLAKYSRMTATDCVLDAVRTIDNFTPSDVSSRHYKGQAFEQWKQNIIKTVIDVASQIDAVEDGNVEGVKEIIRSLARFRKTTAWFGTSSRLTKIANSILDDIDFDTAKAIVNAQLSTLPKDFQKRSVGQVAKTIRIHNMLSALTTVNRNLFGNAAIGIVDAFSDSTVGQALDGLVSLVTKKRTVGNDVARTKTYFSAGAKAAKMAALCAELDIPMESESRFTTGHTRTYSPQGNLVMRFLSAYEKCMKYALEVTDQFFDGGTNAAVEKSLEKLGAKGKLTDEEIVTLSEQIGKRRTFKDDRMLTRAAKGVKEGLNEIGSENIGAGDLVMPFAGTGSNVGHVAVDYSTFGLSGFIDIIRVMCDVKAGKYNKDGVKQIRKNGKVVKTISLAEAQRKAVTNAARGLTGTGLIATFAAFAAAGILGVHDDEDKDKRGLEQSMNLSGAQLNLSAAMRWAHGQSTDWQEDDWCLSVDFLEPFNAQMYLGYLLSREDSVQDMVKAYPTATVRSVYQSLMDMPLMQSLSELSDTVTNLESAVPEGEDMEWKDSITEIGGQLIGSTASSFVPSYIRQTAQVIDPYYRDTTGETAGEKAINQLLATIPFASTTLPQKYSGLGQEQRRYDDLLAGVFNTFVNPGELEQIKSSDIYEYLDELSERTGNVTFFPANAAPGSFTMNGEKVTVSGKDATESYQLTYGTNVNRLYGELIQNADFYSASDELQVEMLNSAKAYAVMLAKAEVTDYSDVPAYIKNRAAGMSEAEAIIRHALLTNSKGDAVYKNTEKYAYLSVSDADYIADLLEGLTTQTDKVSAIADSKLSEKDQKAVMKETLSESAYDKFIEILNLGMSVDDYASSYSIYRKEDATGGKGTKDCTIQKFEDEYDMTYDDAKKLYEIYCPPSKK